jgi:hypothetical protein
VNIKEGKYSEEGIDSALGIDSEECIDSALGIVWA